MKHVNKHCILSMHNNASMYLYTLLLLFQSQQQEGIVGLLLEYLPSIVITISNFVVPLLSDQVARLENYSPSTTVILALLRLDLHSQPP